ncbi:MAG: hypothetical protein ACREGB_00585 [Candidatus Saccharimonadales bacterium]
MLEAAIVDMRKNTWLLPDVFAGLADDPLSKSENGWKEVDKAIKWFMSNEIPVFLQHRIDTPVFPCLSVVLTNSPEDEARASLGDEGMVEEIDPAEIAVTPQRIYQPFTPAQYDPSTGYVTFPAPLDTSLIVAGQFLVSQRSGKAYAISKRIDGQVFQIKAGTKDDFTDATIVPAVALWNVHRELSFLNEAYSIGIHAASDPVQAIWLRQLTIYIMMRYKEAFLEGRGYELSTIHTGPIDLNKSFHPERVFSCFMTLTGQVQMDWIKFVAPKLQAVSGGIRIIDGPKTPAAYQKEVASQIWSMEGDAPPDADEGNESGQP